MTSSSGSVHLGEMSPPRWIGPRQQAELARMGDRLGPAGDAQLAVDGPHLCPDSVDREVKLLADLPGREPGRQQPQDDELPLGEGRAYRAPRAGGRSTEHP